MHPGRDIAIIVALLHRLKQNQFKQIQIAINKPVVGPAIFSGKPHSVCGCPLRRDHGIDQQLN